LTIGQAIANTTSFITKRIDKIETSTAVMRNEMGLIFNGTRFMEERLDTFMFNYTVASTEMLGTMTRFKNDMKKSQVRQGDIH
jgi:hypothetical protein